MGGVGYSQQMGECISKSSAMKAPAEVAWASHREGGVGIQVVEGGEPALKFSHSPLSACEFLHEKFCNNSAAPEEVNLSFMLLDVVIDPSENLVTFTLINQNEINVYLALGGVELVNNTGLTVEIARLKYFEKVTRTAPSPPRGEQITLVPAKMAGEPIFIVLEPLLKNGQTMFIVNRYLFAEGERAYRRKSQTLQVPSGARSGATWPLTCRTSTVATTSSSAMQANSAPSASPTPPASSSHPAATCASATTAPAPTRRPPRSAPSAAQSSGPPSATADF